MTYDKPIIIEKMDINTEEYSVFAKLHAYVNKTGDSAYQKAGSERSQNTLTFEVRYARFLEDIRLDTQIYRLFYRGHRYKIIDYDDYLEKHQNIKLIGVSY